MSTFSHSDITDWRMIPVSEIKMYIHDGTTEHSLEFKNLVDNSNLKIAAITDQDDEGMDVIEAFKLEASITIFENNLQDMLPELRLMTKYKVTKVIFTCKPGSSQPGGGQLDVQVIDTINTNAMRCNWAVNIASEVNQTLDLTIKGLFSTDVLDMTTNPFFKQYWST